MDKIFPFLIPLLPYHQEKVVLWKNKKKKFSELAGLRPTRWQLVKSTVRHLDIVQLLFKDVSPLVFLLWVPVKIHTHYIWDPHTSKDIEWWWPRSVRCTPKMWTMDGLSSLRQDNNFHSFFFFFSSFVLRLK